VRIARYLCVVLGVALLSSCSIGLTLLVTNDSRQPIAISYTRPEKTTITVIEPGAQAHLRYATRFTIYRDGKARLYDASGVEYEQQTFEGWGPFVKRLLKLVYAEDGCVHVTPRVPGDAQPKGFPLCPTPPI